MTQSPDIAFPARDDGWKPSNPLLENVIRKYIDEARREACDTTGNTGTLTGGGLVLVAIGASMGVPALTANRVATVIWVLLTMALLCAGQNCTDTFNLRRRSA